MKTACSIAAATHCFRQPLKRAMRTAAEVGVSGVQLTGGHELRPNEFSQSGRKQFLHMLGEFGLKVAGLSVPLQKSLSDTLHLDERLSIVRSFMEFAFQLKAGVVTAPVGRVPADHNSAEYGNLLAALNDLARYANRVGSVFALTVSGESVATLTDLIAEVKDGPIGLHLDPPRLLSAGLQPAGFFAAMSESVRQVQIRDSVTAADGALLEVAVGRGEVEWEELFAVLHEADYASWMVVERTQGDDRIGDMGRAVKFIRHLQPGGRGI